MAGQLLGCHIRWYTASNKALPGDATVPGSTRSETGLSDEFGVEVSLDRLQAAFRAVAGILHTSERHLRQRETMVVDRDHPTLYCRRDRVRCLGRAGIGIGCEAVRQPICLRYNLIETSERRDDGEPAERFLMHHPCV